MKHLSSVLWANYLAMLNFLSTPKLSRVMVYIILLGTFLIIGCSKEEVSESEKESQTKAAVVTGNILDRYQDLDMQTLWELQQARATSAKYKHIKNAYKDGYADINVVIPLMGYHFLRSSSLDADFDYRDPEILVYNRDENGEFQLVAVEYAVPIALSPSVAPEGFTGDDDVWSRNEENGLWLLHAWVWFYNPAGVFNPTNANIVLR